MAEYIEREAVIREIKTAQETLQSDDDLLWELNKKYHSGLAWAHRIVLEAPAADVAPKVNDAEGGRQGEPDRAGRRPGPEGGLGHVLRCKECKHMNIVGVGYRWCKVWERIQTMGDEGFCCFGERRAE